MKEKFITLLTVASGLKGFGLKFIRVAILVVFVWIGGLKYFHYEADGIVPFVANSPFMSIKSTKTPKAPMSPPTVNGTKRTGPTRSLTDWEL